MTAIEADHDLVSMASRYDSELLWVLQKEKKKKVGNLLCILLFIQFNSKIESHREITEQNHIYYIVKYIIKLFKIPLKVRAIFKSAIFTEVHYVIILLSYFTFTAKNLN